MKKYNMGRKQFVLLLSLTLLLVVGLSSCSRFKDINTPEYLPQTLPMGNYFIQMQNIVYPAQENDYQMNENLIGDVYGRYMSITNSGWATNFATFNAPDDWINAPFKRTFSTFYSAFVEVKKRTNATGVNYAWAQVMKVAAMQRMTDLYGPIPYSKVGSGDISVPYDSQEEVYNQMFADLDAAINTLTAYTISFPGDKPMKDYDKIYNGDYVKWVKFANSLKLRMAMRVVYANDKLARQKAEEAVQHSIGPMTSNEDNAQIRYTPNPIKIMWDQYSDTRACADLVTHMVGYADPRLPKYFAMGTVGGTTAYQGLRTGINIASKASVLPFSAPIYVESDPLLWMMASEVSFLKSEGALRGWTMNGTAQQFYEQGISLSFAQYNVSGSLAAYIADNTKKQVAYNIAPASPAVSTITIKWNEADVFSTKLERLMTQKWIALYPLGQEAWSEQRRTGFPRFFPVIVNKNTDASLTTKFASRIPFAPSEKISNNENYVNAVSLLNGTDTYGTKLWWDKNTQKP
uniref:RagB/SusD family nutrient uptake outer membrane protein n=1 Tax=Pedobacter schmidteae TaxID=2201271 RepID=UPI000EACB42B|nr:RagB/SusD family nutrient uptake outer membrane protein [Pedobacter schmidteae]